MKIGFDIDGVLADFIPAYQQLHVKHADGLDLFHPGDNVDPPCWDWPMFRGYTAEVTKKVWGEIKADPMFWMNLGPVKRDLTSLRIVVDTLERHHDVYYITSRPGLEVKRQTENWLAEHVGYPMIDGFMPTVLIVGTDAKGALCKHLQLDAYIDDNYENCFQCGVQSPKTRTYMLDRAYNRKGDLPETVARVQSLGQMLDIEIALGHL